jgi:hypothetical protein
MKLKLVSIGAAALAAGALMAASTAVAAPQGKAKRLTGVWSGKTHQDIAPLGPDADFVEWEQRITVRANNGHLSYVGVSVRYTCPDATNPLAGDIYLNQSWSVLKNNGPRLTPNGGFSLVVTHVTNLLTGKEVRIFAPLHIRGVLGKKTAGGGFDVSGGGCSGKGTWQGGRKF